MEKGRLKQEFEQKVAQMVAHIDDPFLCGESEHDGYNHPEVQVMWRCYKMGTRSKYSRVLSSIDDLHAKYKLGAMTYNRPERKISVDIQIQPVGFIIDPEPAEDLLTKIYQQLWDRFKCNVCHGLRAQMKSEGTTVWLACDCCPQCQGSKLIEKISSTDGGLVACPSCT